MRGAAPFLAIVFGFVFFAAVFFFITSPLELISTMSLVARPVPVGSRVVDSFPFSIGGTADQARALRREAVDGLVGYLGSMTPQRLQDVADAGLGFMPVTKANEFYDGPADEIAQLKALKIPQGVCVWLDIEGERIWDHGKEDPKEVMRLLSSWAQPINAEGWLASLYVGVPQPLLGPELYALPFVRYWLGIGRCIGRDGKDAYPAPAGWCMRQDWHNQGNGMIWRGTGVLVDTNSVQCDHKGRLPVWAVAA